MIFVERPITVEHVRDVCNRFREGLRVEYKATFDQSVRDQLPKIVSSFANSQGGVLVVGVRTAAGVAQGPFEGFQRQPREEYPLTVENICLRGIHLPVLPITHVVPSDVADHIFLVIEVDESAEAPHAIENSRKVYVRTGNAANPYDLADVDSIIALLKRRNAPLELAGRILSQAHNRSLHAVLANPPLFRISVCPTFPRRQLCAVQHTWEFLLATSMRDQILVPVNSLRRIPDGVASVAQDRPAPNTQQYFELSSYGLLFHAKHFPISNWTRDIANIQTLHFGDLLYALVRTTHLARRLYRLYGFSGQVLIRASVENVRNRFMRFVENQDFFPDNPEDFGCHDDNVSVERLISVEQLRAQPVIPLSDMLIEITWAFWQSYQHHPTERLRRAIAASIAAVPPDGG